MRRLFSCSLAWLILARLAGTTGSVAWAEFARDAPDAAATHRGRHGRGAEDPEAVLEHGLDQERSRNWAAAIETYHDGARTLAQPRRVQPPAPALRDPLQAHPPLPRHQLPQRPAPPAARPGRRALRRGPRAHPDELRRSRAARAAWSATDSTTSRSPCATRSSSRPTRRRPRPSASTWLRETLRQYRAQLERSRPGGRDPHGA